MFFPTRSSISTCNKYKSHPILGCCSHVGHSGKCQWLVKSQKPCCESPWKAIAERIMICQHSKDVLEFYFHTAWAISNSQGMLCNDWSNHLTLQILDRNKLWWKQQQSNIDISIFSPKCLRPTKKQTENSVHAWCFPLLAECIESLG